MIELVTLPSAYTEVVLRPVGSEFVVRALCVITLPLAYEKKKRKKEENKQCGGESTGTNGW